MSKAACNENGDVKDQGRANYNMLDLVVFEEHDLHGFDGFVDLYRCSSIGWKGTGTDATDAHDLDKAKSLLRIDGSILKGRPLRYNYCKQYRLQPA
jgi:hypothetical protein